MEITLPKILVKYREEEKADGWLWLVFGYKFDFIDGEMRLINSATEAVIAKESSKALDIAQAGFEAVGDDLNVFAAYRLTSVLENLRFNIELDDTLNHYGDLLTKDEP